MESNVDDHDGVVVPVPKPRRHNLNTNVNLNNNKLAYENVSIDLINKNINIKEENMQNNAKNKLQTNKLFLMPNTSAVIAATAATAPTAASSSSSNNINETSSSVSGGSSSSSSGSTQILTNLNDLANAPSKNQKNLSIQLDEINKLSNIYNDDENVNVKPVPAPRRSNAPTSQVKQYNCTASTGAISKQSTSFDISDFLESPKSKSKHNNKSKGSYSFAADDDGDATSSDDFVRKFSLKKRLSNSSLSSSQSGSSSTADPNGSKYSSASPG